MKLIVCVKQVPDTSGKVAVNADGTLDRAWMAGHVFGPDAAPGARERLGDIEHPLIYRAAARIEREHPDARLVVHDVPLLAEVIGSIPFRFDHIVTVEAPEEERIARMTGQRGMTRAQAEDRIRHQSTRAQREAIADVVIDSSRPVACTARRLADLYALWTREA